MSWSILECQGKARRESSLTFLCKGQTRSWWKSHIFKSPLGWETARPGSQIPGRWLRRKEVAQGMGHGNIPVCVQAGRAGRSEKPEAPWHRHLQDPSAPQQCSSCPQEPGHGTQSMTARSGTPQPEPQDCSQLTWETTMEEPPGQAGLQGPQPLPAGTGIVSTEVHG